MDVSFLEIEPETLLERLGPEEPTSEELEAAARIGSGDRTIYKQKLDAALDEAREVFVRTAVSGMAKSGDLVVAIHNPNGDLTSASCGTYLHGPIAQLPVKFIVDRYMNNSDSTVEINPGDIFYANEAVIGGLHNPDQVAIMPIFHEGTLIGWASAALHAQETGAIEPGGMPQSATTRYDEGMRLTPIKIGEDYELKDDLLDMMANFNSRSPRMHSIDVRARCSSVDKLRVRVEEIAEETSADFVLGLFRKMIDTAEIGVRNRISTWPDGTFRSVGFFDTTGVDESLMKITLTLVKEGDEITLDFSGTSPEAGSYNSFVHGAASFLAAYLYPYVFHDMPVSTGAYAPFSFEIPEGTILNPSMEASVVNCVHMGHVVVGLCHNVFTRMMYGVDPERTAASLGTYGGGTIFTGVTQHGITESDILTYVMNSYGAGARYDKDGVDAHGFFYGPWGKSPNVEDREEQRVLAALVRGFHPDSAGFGKYRGGSGVQDVKVITSDHPVQLMSMGTGPRLPQDLGLFGGYSPPAPPGISVTETDVLEKLADGESISMDGRELVSKQDVDGEYHFERINRHTRTSHKGDLWLTFSAGGAAIGDPLDRDPEEVLEDVKRGLVSEWAASNVFKVAIEDGTLDRDRTEELRAAEREDRIDRGVSLEEFEETWETKRPPEEALTSYGEWPDAITGDEGKPPVAPPPTDD